MIRVNLVELVYLYLLFSCRYFGRLIACEMVRVENRFVNTAFAALSADGVRGSHARDSAALSALSQPQ